jgi:hypothetical protein
VCFCSGMARLVGATFLASATMAAEAPKQALVVAISRALLSHLKETSRSRVDSEDSAGSRHLRHQIGVVWDGHEPGQHGGT